MQVQPEDGKRDCPLVQGGLWLHLLHQTRGLLGDDPHRVAQALGRRLQVRKLQGQMVRRWKDDIDFIIELKVLHA